MAKVYYFQHDFMAREDPKLMAVQERFGLEGLGFYWCLVEYLYEQGGNLRIDSIDPFAYRMHFDKKKAKAVISEFDLFENDGVMFWSPSIKRRIAKMSDVAEKRRMAAQNRWNNTNVKPEAKKAANGEKTDYQEIIRIFHECCPSLSTIQKLTEGRRNKIKLRLKEMGSIEKMAEVFRRVEGSDFCKGNNERGWKADFDWIMTNDSNWQKVLSGRYDNEKKKAVQIQKEKIETERNQQREEQTRRIDSNYTYSVTPDQIKKLRSLANAGNQTAIGLMNNTVRMTKAEITTFLEGNI